MPGGQREATGGNGGNAGPKASEAGPHPTGGNGRQREATGGNGGNARPKASEAGPHPTGGKGSPGPRHPRPALTSPILTMR